MDLEGPGSWQENQSSLRELWRRLSTSESSTLHSTEMVGGSTSWQSGIICGILDMGRDRIVKLFHLTAILPSCVVRSEQESRRIAKFVQCLHLHPEFIKAVLVLLILKMIQIIFFFSILIFNFNAFLLNCKFGNLDF